MPADSSSNNWSRCYSSPPPLCREEHPTTSARSRTGLTARHRLWRALPPPSAIRWSQRLYATDFATPPTVLVIDTHAALPSGLLTSFSTYDQALPGGSPTGSGPNTFDAFVLRPTGIANQYTVVFDTGPLSVPSVTTDTVETYSVPPVGVQAGDVIAHYGQGIPVDDLGTGADTLVYPAGAMPVTGQTITVGDATYPVVQHESHLLHPGVRQCADRLRRHPEVR